MKRKERIIVWRSPNQLVDQSYYLERMKMVFFFWGATIKRKQSQNAPFPGRENIFSHPNVNTPTPMIAQIMRAPSTYRRYFL